MDLNGMHTKGHISKFINKILITFIAFIEGMFVGLNRATDPLFMRPIYDFLLAFNDQITFNFFTLVFPLILLLITFIIMEFILGKIGFSAVIAAFVGGMVLFKWTTFGIVLSSIGLILAILIIEK
jgi:hypothetical protein